MLRWHQGLGSRPVEGSLLPLVRGTLWYIFYDADDSDINILIGIMRAKDEQGVHQ